ncbi:hypothetical protein TWF718_000742 [Orbilia javanica]|uniref:DUF7603 domain-containing protein n=1 Tax=Orbilia javanica TaxID=47235 RepID=A0AAN8N4P3_9PEZI
MESPLRRSIIDTSLFPQPPSRNRPAIASFGSPVPGAAAAAVASGYRTPTQSFFRQSTSSTSSSAPYSPPRHSKERSFSTATGHSKTSSSDSRSHLTSLSSRSSLYSEDNDFDSIDSKIKSSLTIATSITSSAESPVDPYFKIHHHSAPPKSPVLELFRSQLADKSASTTNNRWSLDLFSAPSHASGPGSPRRHPLQQNLSSSDIDVDTSRNNKSETQRGSVVATNAINTHRAEQKHTKAYPSISSLIEEPLGRLSRAFSMPHVITQQAPGLPNQSMLNRSNSTNTESSFIARTPARTKTGFGSLFGWGASSNHENSPIERPVSLAEQRMSKVPSNIDVTLANSQPSHPKRTDSGISLPPRTPMSVEEILEEELRALSADLASSIRREVELEDLVESLQATAESQGKLSPGLSKRTSDYFSDAGTGPSYDFDIPSKEQLDYDRVVRKSEQAQAQIRLELTQRIQEERQRRKGVELQVRELEERVGNVEYGSLRPPSPGRVRDLELALDDARRKLSEERNLKANFEDLVTAIRDELHGYRNERDNLRDEIVPQLRARVEGLEAELAESQKNPYDATKMQQEIDDLRGKYSALVESSRQMQMQQEKSVSVESPVVTQPATPVNTTFKENDSLVEQIREIKLQRDALQDGLRNLRLRNELENKKALHRIRTLEWERDRAMRPSFRRMRKNKEITTFKNQVERLRHRAENAIDSKYVCERNLASLRLDLDRLEQELEELRDLLKTQDTLARQVEELQESCKQLLAECEGDAELEQFAAELRSRSVSNAMLRKRLVDAIERGDQDRLMANTKINALCELLKSMEEKIGEAQQDLEEVATEREQETRDLKEAKGVPRLRRVDEKAAMDTQPNSALIAAKEPRINRDSRGKDTRLYVLQHRIEQLEKTVTNTDIEMEDLESRLNMTLLEASELRTETEQSSEHITSLRSKLSSLQSR